MRNKLKRLIGRQNREEAGMLAYRDGRQGARLPEKGARGKGADFLGGLVSPECQ